MSDLKDLADIDSLVVDDFCGTRYGKQNQLEVIWWNGLKGNDRKYIVKCDVCSQDEELHGEGYFLSYKGHIDRVNVPCACSNRPYWTEDQLAIRAKRAAEEKGLVFCGWATPFINTNKTKVSLECPDHGVFNTMLLSFLIGKSSEKGCPGCFAVRMGDFKRKPDDEMIAKFFDTGCYHPGTKFYRGEREDKHGHKKYWYMDCPECGETGEGHVVGLYKGARSCSCSNNRQKQAYINLVKDGDVVVAIKYGVATYYQNRVDAQNTRSVFDIVNYGVWEFPEVIQCKGAERTCSHILERGIVTKQEMPDGHSETTYVYNLEKVIEIYEQYGGVRL